MITEPDTLTLPRNSRGDPVSFEPAAVNENEASTTTRTPPAARQPLPAEPKVSATPAPVSGLPRKSRMRRTLLLSVSLALLFSAGVWLRHWWQIGRFMEETDDAFIGGDTTMISSRVPGFITKVSVTDNQRVRSGDLLATIDDRDYHAQAAKADAAVAAQEATLANLDAATELQAALIEQARARTESSAAEKQRADLDAARSRSLIKTRAVSQQDVEQSDATSAKAAADDHASKAALIAAQRQLLVIATQKTQTEAALAQANAERELARLNLGFTEIRSPIDGVVGNRHAQVGAYMITGAQLLSIVPSEGLWVDANFKESQIAHMRAGQRVTIRADVLPGVEIHGTVESLAPATGAEFSLLPPENATGNFTRIVQRVPIRIRLDGEAARLGRLRPGLSAVARVDLR